MDRDRGYNFKLLVPPWVNRGQISAVRPQEIVDDGGVLKQVKDQFSPRVKLGAGHNTSFEKALSNANMAPTKPNRQDVPKTRVSPSMENDENNSGQLYTKLFDEVDKIKSWKVKTDSESVQKERKLQENKRIIETQRKAIQELQFENESLSIKLEDQINENEDLRNTSNATRNLCHLLKDSFEHSAENMHLFESEREETHHLFLKNSDSIQKMITAFENLRIQAEADQHEMQQVKEALLQFEELKNKLEQEYNVKFEEVTIVKTKLKVKEDELEKVLVKLHETQESCKQLQEENGKDFELLQSSKNEQVSLLQKLKNVEELWKEVEKKLETVNSALEQNKDECAQVILKKDSSIEHLSKVKDQQAKMLLEIEAALNEREASLTSEKERAKELELNLKTTHMDLENTMAVLGETREQSLKKDERLILIDDQLDMTSKSNDALMLRNKHIEASVQELTAELSRTHEAAKHYNNQIEMVSSEKHVLETAYLASKMEHNDLKEKASMAETKVQEMEGLLVTEIEKREASNVQIEQLKTEMMQHEIRYEELSSRFYDLQSEKNTIQEQFEKRRSFDVTNLEAKLMVGEEREKEISREIQILGEENKCLREDICSLNIRIEEQSKIIEDLEENLGVHDEDLQHKITKKEKQIKAVEAKLCNLKIKFEAKSKAQEECIKENKTLQKQMAKETERSSQLKDEMNNIKEGYDNIGRQKEEEHQLLLEELGVKSTIAAELQNEVQMLKLTASEATKNKEEVEMKCQHKIASMVALMEKHKSQYDEMVKEKDAELEKNRKKQKEALAQRSSLELELSQNKIENDAVTKKLKKSMKEKETNMKTIITPSWNAIKTFRSTPKNKEILKEDLKTPSWSTGTTSRVGTTPKIKSYRIRTPPSVERSGRWEKGILTLDPKSDSSEQNDLLTFTAEPEARLSAPQRKVNLFKAMKSPAVCKSPGISLKMAATKRMRDAGWTTVTGRDKKKKMTIEKIFA